jgi:molecular chaperone DnaJ
MATDLYSVLNVSKSATADEIKKAYRQLARKYHPDVNKDKGAVEKFKEVQKAYDVLSDAQKKAQYDQFGVTDDQQGGFGGGAGFEGFGADSFEDIFDVFFGGGKKSRKSGQAQGPRRGEDLRYDMDLELEDVAKGVSRNVSIYHMERCEPCKGTGAKPGSTKSTCQQCQGSGQLRTVQRTMLGNFSQVTPCPHCDGTGQAIKDPCGNCHGRGIEKKRKEIRVEVPAGVDKGTRLRVTGEGNCGENSGPAGDLYVFINVKDHKYFERHNSDIYMELNVPFYQLILGAEVEIPTLDGKALLKIPAGTQAGTILRLKGKGLANMRGFGAGDHHVKITPEFPKSVSGKEKKVIEEYAAMHPQKAGNLFERVRKLF